MTKFTRFLILVLLISLPFGAFATNLQIDLNHSSITFEALHLKVSTIPGRFHEFNGAIDMNDADPTQSKINFSVQIASITTGIPQRDEHLKSADFFDAANFPQATFVSTTITRVDGGYILEGDLSIRGTTKKVSFNVKDLGKVQDPTMGNIEKSVFRATGEINRKDFGVSYGPDAIVSDIIELAFNIEAMPASTK